MTLLHVHVQLHGVDKDLDERAEVNCYFGRRLSGRSRTTDSLSIRCAEVTLSDLTLHEPDSLVQRLSVEDKVLQLAVMPLGLGHGLAQVAWPRSENAACVR